ncbi:MAG: 5'-methylthioadenosine/S-adenosylhomocysteine nucleosidase [Deltaproteobacteria bacterium]|nr:5'-methylthioadenosine/S-adenosylhomocysteine nucleosidase [Deltaproteobacteria bacterium]
MKKLLKATIFIILIFNAGFAMAKEPDNIPRIALASAFEPEINIFLREMKEPKKTVINGKTFITGKLVGKDVVLFLSGISIINASVNIQIAIDNFNISKIIFSGIAGGVNPDLHIGDVVVPKKWANYQEQAFAYKDKNSWELMPWHTKDFNNFNMIFPQYTMITSKGNAPDKEEAKFWFDADPDMLKIAYQIAPSVVLEQCANQEKCLKNAPKIKIGGLGVSGPTFVNNKKYREWVWNNFTDSENNRIDALDMESSAAATVAYMNKIPFIAFRSLSDLAGGGDEKNQLTIFFQLAADNAAKMVLKFLEKL